MKIPCFECPGTLEEKTEDYVANFFGEGEVIVKDVTILVCPDCGDKVHPGTCKKIDEAMAKRAEELGYKLIGARYIKIV